jgi:heme-degrading monooxygenase HmoA
MTVTEFATLEVLPPHDSYSPFVQNFLKKVAAMQSAASGYPMLFFKDASNATTVHILAGWADAETHQKWIASEANRELLEDMESNVAVKNLIHLDIDFTKFPVDSNAKVVRLSKFSQNTLPKEVAGESDSLVIWEGMGRGIESNGDEVYCLHVRTGIREDDGYINSETLSKETTVINMLRLSY